MSGRCICIHDRLRLAACDHPSCVTPEQNLRIFSPALTETGRKPQAASGSTHQSVVLRLLSSVMSDLRIEKGRTSVLLTMAGAGSLSGEMFIQSYSRRGDGPENPEDILNDAEPFFPLALDDGNTMLIAKDQV